uniref:Prohibitin n=1 Tax=Fibrocapsa japonica TaxID=94617 RepID=A0A7S2XWM3_9STRA|mmetsp:Transcript_17084/g.24965  ORF Transcript_17084/g.24965 Transcript_17084/m.24965 type:complete len:277 (+) Transcript_17084:83-913(+)|eukprot:CAMPEP_0113944336 /NCGR_PEP_ID=MMETSP1339-20121228/33432_1 /TAXON_ID=94617 /ORGANISM="Fibrocapsa japonica" /LENGTH=276 /DNA_ID=CAMNT_0000949505 /DNA_START=61 /DNA_END=891 /DNA_ORIENTATION=- /assembly_acc=CAM_ASM_000762
MAERVLGLLTKIGLAATAGGVVVKFCLVTVDGGQRAVIFDKFKGILPDSCGEGMHFLIPIIQEPHILDIRARPRVINSVTGTKDLQMVNISLRVLSRPEEDKISHIFRTLGTDFDERVLPSLGNEVLKAIVAQYNAEDLLRKRDEVSEKIREALRKRAGAFNLILDDVSITHLTFGREYAKAIESKQVAQQEAERQQYVVAKADQERKAAIIRAEGEAEAATLISKALAGSGSGLIEVRRIDAAREVAENLAAARGVTYLPGGQGGGQNILLGLNN